jgi:hypothetical protein
MNYTSLKKDDLKYHLFSLMDQVAQHLQIEPDVDKFIDNTDIFEEWEKVLPEPEYPIFVMAVLNNTRRDSIVNSILDAILDDVEYSEKPSKNASKTRLPRSHVGEHPFS